MFLIPAHGALAGAWAVPRLFLSPATQQILLPERDPASVTLQNLLLELDPASVTFQNLVLELDPASVALQNLLPQSGPPVRTPSQDPQSLFLVPAMFQNLLRQVFLAAEALQNFFQQLSWRSR